MRYSDPKFSRRQLCKELNVAQNLEPRRLILDKGRGFLGGRVCFRFFFLFYLCVGVRGIFSSFFNLVGAWIGFPFHFLFCFLIIYLFIIFIKQQKAHACIYSFFP